MFGAPPPEQPDPRRKPKNPAGNSPISFVGFISLLGMLILGIYIMSQAFHAAYNTPNVSNSAVDEAAVSKPRKPATVLDDDGGILLVYPSPSWAADEQLIKEMAFAKSEWQKTNPHKHVMACDHLRDRPTDYGYCWVIHYDKR